MRTTQRVLQPFLLLALAATLDAQTVGVSPGAEDRVTAVGDPCPTFSWGARGTVEELELAVYQVSTDLPPETDVEPAPKLRVSLPGSAASFTPPLDLCLEAGATYAWTVRSVAPPDSWSPPRFFRVVAGHLAEPRPPALVAVDREAPSRRRPVAETSSGPETRSARPETDSPIADPPPSGAMPAAAPPPHQLSVDGGVSASHFTGSGAGLTDLDPAGLSSVVPLSKGGTGAADAAGARANLDVAQGAHTVDTNAATLCSPGRFLNGDGSCSSHLGVDDVTQGALTLFGDSGVGGAQLELYNAAGEDAKVDSWRLEAADDLHLYADSYLAARFGRTSGFLATSDSISDPSRAIEGDLSTRSVNGYLGVEGGVMEGWNLTGHSLGALGLNDDTVNTWGVGVYGGSLGGASRAAGLKGQGLAFDGQIEAFGVHATGYGTGDTQVRGVWASGSSTGPGTVYGLEAIADGNGIAIPIQATGSHEIGTSLSEPDAHLRLTDGSSSLLLDENEIEAVGASGGNPLYLNYNQDGNVLLGGRLYVGSFTTSGSATLCWDGNGGSYVNDCASLRELKTNIRDLDLGVAELMALRPRQFDWKDGPEDDLGFVAEEVAAVSPTLASYTDGELSGVKYRHLTALLTRVVQQQQREIERLREEGRERERRLLIRLEELEALITQVPTTTQVSTGS